MGYEGPSHVVSRAASKMRLPFLPHSIENTSKTTETVMTVSPTSHMFRPLRHKKQVLSPFVGRRKEIAAVQKCLARGEDIIISGRFGVGRTRLVRYIAEVTKDERRFLFADFSGTAGETCRRLFAELFVRKSVTRTHPGYKAMRHLIAGFKDDKRKIVIVLDNIAAVTNPKLNLLKHWKFHGNFQFILITETFLPDEQLMQLRGCLDGGLLLVLNSLPLSCVQEFFEKCSREYRLALPLATVRGMAKAAGGHPLTMINMVASELGRRQSAGITN
jgi:hypothetical protein